MPHEPYLNSVQAAAYLGFDGRRAAKNFLEFARRHQLRKFHRGSTLLFRRIDLDEAVGNVQLELELVKPQMLRAALTEPRRRA